MGLKKFDSWHAFGFGFNTVFANLRLFLPFMIGALLVSAIISAVTSSIIDSSIASQILTIIINSVIALALFRISLGFLDNHPPSLNGLFGSRELVLNFIAASLIYWIMAYVGLLLLVVPGVYALLTYSLYGLEMVDRGLGPIQALKRSAEMTKGIKWSLLRLGLEFYCGFIAIGIMLFILVLFPFVSIGIAVIFLQAACLLEISTISPDLMSMTLPAMGLIAGSTMAAIVIPSYALAFAFIYRSLEPASASAHIPAQVNQAG